MRWYFYSASYPESKCHPERSDRFATRSSRAVEGPYLFHKPKFLGFRVTMRGYPR